MQGSAALKPTCLVSEEMRATCEDGLVHAQRRGLDGGHSDVSRYLVTNCKKRHENKPDKIASFSYVCRFFFLSVAAKMHEINENHGHIMQKQSSDAKYQLD